MTYSIRNTGSLGKSFEAENGKRINIEPGEEKEVESLPPEVDDLRKSFTGWEIEKQRNSKSEENEEEVNE